MTHNFRVTGLDPAGPLFERVTEEVRIDRSDAPFVDIIHTNGGNENDGFLGLNADVGHADYFPNGGHQQPKCNNNFYCAHMEAPGMYIDSISNGCVFNKCPSEKDYNRGNCDTCTGVDCNYYGWLSTKPDSNTLYYADLSPFSPPYC